MLLKRKKMMKRFAMLLYPMLLIPVLRFSDFSGKDMFELIEYITDEMEQRPFRFVWCKNTLPVAMVFSLLYVMTWFLIITSMKNTRWGEEHGSSRWEDAVMLGRRLRSKKRWDQMLPVQKSQVNRISRELGEGFFARRRRLKERRRKDHIEWLRKNLIFTRHVLVDWDTEYCDNLNAMIIGGSGRMKSRGLIIPNIMQMNCNPVVTDPKGELLRKLGWLLEKNGYEIRVLDLVEHFRSHGYNPFPYFRSDEEVLVFVNNMWAAMEDKTAAKGEQIWDDQAKNMMMSLCLYLHHYAPPDEQNLSTVMELFNHINDSEDKKMPDPVDQLFAKIPRDDTAYTYYLAWSTAAGRTLASIRATFSSRMSVFNLPSMKALTYKDEMNLLDLATKKIALFMVIPDNNKVYNFLAGTLYTQMFQQLYDYSDHVIHGPLPKHVRFFMDEFANIALPDDYEKILSTARSRNVSFMIVIQDKQQLEALFKDYYRSIFGNCSWQMFLGSLELETCKYFSEILGKETVSVFTSTKNYGRQGGSSRQEQLIERDLLLPSELRGLKRKQCVLITPYHGVVLDDKFDMKRHPQYRDVADRKRDVPYIWGESPLSIGSVSILTDSYGGKLTPLPETDGELLDPDLLDAM